jgi:hypothetical protein
MKDAESAMKSLTDDLLLLLSRKVTGYVLSKSKSDNYPFLSKSKVLSLLCHTLIGYFLAGSTGVVS